MTYKNIRAVTGSLGAAIVGTSLASTFFYGVKSAVAAGVTYALGRVMITWIASGKTIPIDKLKEIFDRYKSEYKKENVDIKVQSDIKYIQYSKEAELYSNDSGEKI